MNPFELSSSAGARFAVKPIDYVNIPKVNHLEGHCNCDVKFTDPFGHPSLDDIIQTHKCTTQNEQYVGSVDVICIRFS